MLLAQPRETLRFLRSIYYVPNLYWADRLRQMRIDPAKATYHRGTNELELDELGVVLSPDEHAFVLQAYQHAALLHTQVGASFAALPDGALSVEVDGLTFHVHTAGQLYNLREQFVDGIYNILPCDKPTVMWDIGMNAGIAALCFASKPGTKVIGFEPFAETFSQAQQNVAHNPHLAEHITCINAGVGGHTRKMQVQYDPAHSDRSGIFALQNGESQMSNADQVTIELRSGAEILEWIVEQYPDHNIVAKIDCEGAEYEILESLAERQLLRLINSILMEWHVLDADHCPNRLTRILCEAGFTVLYPRPHATSGGMMYAFRAR